MDAPEYLSVSSTLSMDLSVSSALMLLNDMLFLENFDDIFLCDSNGNCDVYRHLSTISKKSSYFMLISPL